MSTIVAGGIAFAAPPHTQAGGAPENMQFILEPDQASALAPPDGPAQYIELRFEHSLPGLAVGAPVQIAGMGIGTVVWRDLDYDQAQGRFPTMVGILVYPQRQELQIRTVSFVERMVQRQ